MKTPPDLENVTTLATAHRSSARTGPRALSDDTHHHVPAHVTPNRSSRPRTPGFWSAARRRCTRALPDQQARVPAHDQALAAGWPIAAGVIKGARRQQAGDRLDITAARLLLVLGRIAVACDARPTASTMGFTRGLPGSRWPVWPSRSSARSAWRAERPAPVPPSHCAE